MIKHTQPEHTFKPDTQRRVQETMDKLVEALLLAITAPTTEQARKAVWLAGELTYDLTAKQVAQCQKQAQRQIKNITETKPHA